MVAVRGGVCAPQQGALAHAYPGRVGTTHAKKHDEDRMPTTTNNSDRGLPSTRGPGELADAVRSWAESPAGLAVSRAPQARYFDSTMKMLPGVTLPLRSMLVTGATAQDRQLLISPVATSQEAAEIGPGPLSLIAPSLLHHVHLQTAIEHYRPVTLWGPPGLAEHRPSLAPMLVFGRDPWPYEDLLSYVVVEGAPRRNEVVFFHRPSKTVYTADLFFNVQHAGLLSSLPLRMMGVYQRFGMAKLWKRWVTDREAFGRSIEQILQWDFDRVVMAHGEPLEHDAHDRCEIALRELALID